MAEKTDFLAGLVVGTLVGIGLGMLFAPQTGQETREKLKSKADEMGGRLRTTAEEAGSRAREGADDIASKVKETLDEQAQRLREAYERGREVVQRKREDILGRIGESDES